MIVVRGELRLHPEQRDAALDAFRPAIAATRAEAGCHAYEYAVDIDDPNYVQTFELFEDDAAVDAHMGSEHVATLMASLGGALESVSIVRYDVTGSRKVL